MTPRLYLPDAAPCAPGLLSLAWRIVHGCTALACFTLAGAGVACLATLIR